MTQSALGGQLDEAPKPELPAPEAGADGRWSLASQIFGTSKEGRKELLAFIPLVLLALRISAVSHDQISTERTLISKEGVLDVIFGAFAPLYPYLLFLTTVGFILLALFGPSERRLFAAFFSLVLLLLTLIHLPAEGLVYMTVWCLAVGGSLLLLRFLICRFAVRDRGVSRPQAVLQVFSMTVLALVLFQIGTDDAVWVHAEEISYYQLKDNHRTTNTMTGYVIDSEWGDITVLRDSDRTIQIISREDIISRSSCYGSSVASTPGRKFWDNVDYFRWDTGPGLGHMVYGRTSNDENACPQVTQVSVSHH